MLKFSNYMCVFFVRFQIFFSLSNALASLKRRTDIIVCGTPRQRKICIRGAVIQKRNYSVYVQKTKLNADIYGSIQYFNLTYPASQVGWSRKFSFS